MRLPKLSKFIQKIITLSKSPFCMISPTTSDTTFSNAITLISIFIILLASCLLIKCLCTQSPIVLRSLFNFLYKDYL